VNILAEWAGRIIGLREAPSQKSRSLGQDDFFFLRKKIILKFINYLALFLFKIIKLYLVLLK
jgi:hypothetical protein